MPNHTVFAASERNTSCTTSSLVFDEAAIQQKKKRNKITGDWNLTMNRQKFSKIRKQFDVAYVALSSHKGYQFLSEPLLPLEQHSLCTEDNNRFVARNLYRPNLRTACGNDKRVAGLKYLLGIRWCYVRAKSARWPKSNSKRFSFLSPISIRCWQTYTLLRCWLNRQS